MSLRKRILSKLIYFVAGALIGYIFEIECVKSMNVEYMEYKFEYLQKNNIDSYKEECLQLGLDCSAYIYKKDDKTQVDIYLENIKLTKTIGDDNNDRRNNVH